MKKTLITATNYENYVDNGKLFVTKDTIITPGAKDCLRSSGIELVYGVQNKNDNCNCHGNFADSISSNIDKKCDVDDTIDKMVVELLVKEFNISDVSKIKSILAKVKELLC